MRVAAHENSFVEILKLYWSTSCKETYTTPTFVSCFGTGRVFETFLLLLRANFISKCQYNRPNYPRYHVMPKQTRATSLWTLKPRLLTPANHFLSEVCYQQEMFCKL